MPPAPRNFAGRRLWFAGIGGAGLSAYALLARAWGADVRGWDRAETPYLAPVRAAGIGVELSAEPPPPPDGWEAVVSTAYAGAIRGRSRAEFLAELVSLQPSIVVTGTHGKTTTTGMVAFCLDRLGRDPAWLIGGEIPQLGANARAGSGWLVVEGDESDRTIASLRPEIAVVTNIELDHHTTFASRAEVEAMFESWLAAAPHAVRGDLLAPYDGELAVPGAHNRSNAACALAALELTRVPREEAVRALREFRGAARRLERRGEASGVGVVDSYAHHPTEIAADIAAARELDGGGRLLVVFQPHLFSRTRYLARELAAALATADAVCVTDVYPAREEPLPGVTGKLVVDQLTEVRPGLAVGWTPAPEDSVRFLVERARPGDLVLTLGAGDVDRIGSLVLEALA